MFEELACGLLFCYFIGWGCIYKVIKVLGIKLHWEGVEFCKSSFYENVRGRIYIGMKVLAMKIRL